jgi:plasmid stabilization system protein ParE
MTFQVQFTRAAKENLEQLFDFTIQREVGSATGDLDIADRALKTIRTGIQLLQTSAFTCRKASNSPFLRELVIPFGSSGYVVLFEIASVHEVIIAAIRHQREDDYY